MNFFVVLLFKFRSILAICSGSLRSQTNLRFIINIHDWTNKKLFFLMHFIIRLLIENSLRFFQLGVPYFYVDLASGLKVTGESARGKICGTIPGQKCCGIPNPYISWQESSELAFHKLGQFQLLVNIMRMGGLFSAQTFNFGHKNGQSYFHF